MTWNRRNRRQPASILLLAATSIAATGPPLLAAAGDLDPSFGTGGRLTVPFNYGGDFEDRGAAVAIQPDGKVLVVGSVQVTATDHDFAIARFDATGALDPTFDAEGKSEVAFDLGTSKDDRGVAVAVQPDGKIVVVGSVAAALGDNLDFGVARLHAAGHPDTSFDTDGKTSIAFDLAEDLADTVGDVALQSDGRIVVVGTVTSGADLSDCAVVRLLADGALDPSFGVGGKVVVSFDQKDVCRSVAVQADGRIVVAGQAAGTVSDLVVARFLADGTLDSSFGTFGKVALGLAPGSIELGGSLTLQADGRPVVVGMTLVPPSSDFDMAVARLQADGTLDASFDGDGWAVVDFAGDHDFAEGVVVHTDGAVVAAGFTFVSSSSRFDFAVARLLPNGGLDPGFGAGGKRVAGFDLGQENEDFAHGVAIRRDHRIVVVGTVQGATADDDDLGVVQLLPEPTIFDDGFESGDTSGWTP